ncbi:hypothetical protein OAU52_00450 [bacterium]|nr:hypothetical protein [bacterium]
MKVKYLLGFVMLLGSICYSNEKASMMAEVPFGFSAIGGASKLEGLYVNTGFEGYFKKNSTWVGGSVILSGGGEVSMSVSNGSNSMVSVAGLLRNYKLGRFYSFGITYGLGAYGAKVIQNPESCPVSYGFSFDGNSSWCDKTDLPRPIYESEYGLWIPVKVQAGLRYKIVSLGVTAGASYFASLSKIKDMGGLLSLGVYAGLIF